MTVRSAIRLTLPLLLVALGLAACVLPADIEERPGPADGDEETAEEEETETDGEPEFAYWPIFIKSRPADPEILIPHACKTYTFRLLLVSLPDEEDEARRMNFAVRWFMDWSKNPNPIWFRGLDSVQEYLLDPSALDPTQVHLLEAVVSDTGFVEDSSVTPRNRAPKGQTPHTDRESWLIRLDTSTVITPDNEDVLCQ